MKFLQRFVECKGRWQEIYQLNGLCFFLFWTFYLKSFFEVLTSNIFCKICFQDSKPQRPTNVAKLLHPGTNLLQTIGCFGGFLFNSYLFLIKFQHLLFILLVFNDNEQILILLTGSYFIAIGLFDDIPLPVYPSLKDYVHSEVTESDSGKIFFFSH